MRSLCLAALAFTLSGCQLGGVDAHMPEDSGDGGAPPIELMDSCFLRAPLELGRCVSATSGAPCLGQPGEATRFMPLDGTRMTWTRGPHGPEIVLAVRGRGMELAGSSPAELIVTSSGGVPVAHQDAMLQFSGDDVSAESTVVFLVMDPRSAGRLLRATVALEDRNRQRRCGSVHFVVEAAP